MADSALITPESGRPAISNFVQRDFDEQISEGKFYPRSVLAMLMIAANGAATDFTTIGAPSVEGKDPGRGLWIGTGSERLRMLKSVGSDTFQPAYRLRPASNTVTRHQSFFDNNAVQANWSANTIPQTIKRGAVKWVYHSEEIIVSKDEQNFIRDGDAVPGLSLTVETSREVRSQMLSTLDSDLHISTGPVSTTSDYWSGPYGVKEWCKDSGVIAGIDRDDAANAAIRGNYMTSWGAVSFWDMYMYDNFSTSGPQLNKYGATVHYYLCDGDMFSKAVLEAKQRGYTEVMVGKLPELPQYGFGSMNAVKIDPGCTIICDPGMTSGEIFGYNPRGWSMGLKKNFTLTQAGFFDHSMIRGQPRILRGEMELMYIGPICNTPWAQTYRTGCT